MHKLREIRNGLRELARVLAPPELLHPRRQPGRAPVSSGVRSTNEPDGVAAAGSVAPSGCGAG